ECFCVNRNTFITLIKENEHNPGEEILRNESILFKTGYFFDIFILCAFLERYLQKVTKICSWAYKNRNTIILL
ncbi:MAG: hypothetical protein IKK29_01910, partial [Christensenellaceae bacterium]|nr:hypothetical protein [Christensenellaceae bacterium]